MIKWLGIEREKKGSNNFSDASRAISELRNPSHVLNQPVRWLFPLRRSNLSGEKPLHAITITITDRVFFLQLFRRSPPAVFRALAAKLIRLHLVGFDGNLMGSRYSPDCYCMPCLTNVPGCANPHNDMYSMVDENCHEFPVKLCFVGDFRSVG